MISAYFWSRVRRGLRRAVPDWETLGICWGAVTVGAVTLLPPPQGEEDPGARAADDTGAPLSGPPAGHPERAVPTLPLSEVERALWSQLS